jgi:hypothetical protein
MGFPEISEGAAGQNTHPFIIPCSQNGIKPKNDDMEQYSGHFWERAVSLTAYAPVESGYFIQVSLLPDLNKMMLKDGDPLSAVIPIAENCPEY